ncbi:hypothetical protein KIPB_011183 [Kipferlia bialata]|uniref:Uncharacterized protein n=1 Tax=Kipferlia bialata TaxID=797122 RepID=A0A9K3GN51_9EUKA|nr:hypothetical protein KIPB_011183 [Kipferlia bialata]|eukprot:g11183.t1
MKRDLSDLRTAVQQNTTQQEARSIARALNSRGLERLSALPDNKGDIPGTFPPSVLALAQLSGKPLIALLTGYELPVAKGWNKDDTNRKTLARFIGVKF